MECEGNYLICECKLCKNEIKKHLETLISEFGCSSPVNFITSEGIKTMIPGKKYDENLNEI